VYFALAVMFYRETEFMLAYLSAFLHEISHALLAIRLGIMPTGIDISIFGIRLKTPFIQNSRLKILISLIGPAASFFLFGIFYGIGYIFSFKSPFYYFFVYANLFIGLINILPILPLDGGSVLKAVFAKHLGIIWGAKVYNMISVFFYAFFAVINIFLAVYKIFNPSLILILIFVLMGIRKEHIISLLEKKIVLSGQVISKEKIKYLACDSESELLSLASRISSEYTLMAVAFCDERFLGELSQNEITDGIKKYGALCTVGNCLRKKYTDMII